MDHLDTILEDGLRVQAPPLSDDPSRPGAAASSEAAADARAAAAASPSLREVPPLRCRVEQGGLFSDDDLRWAHMWCHSQSALSSPAALSPSASAADDDDDDDDASHTGVTASPSPSGLSAEAKQLFARLFNRKVRGGSLPTRTVCVPRPVPSSLACLLLCLPCHPPPPPPRS